MRVLIAYDVNTENEKGKTRLRKVAKQCMNYGIRVQNSLFECILEGTQLEMLKNSLLSIIDEDTDSILIYYLHEKAKTEQFGVRKGVNIRNDTLIV